MTESDAENIIDFLIARLRAFPGTDEQELAERLSARRTLLVWWILDFIAEQDKEKELL